MNQEQNAPREFEYDAFVSYSRSDRPFVKMLVEALSAQELNVWWDAKGLHGGQMYDKELEAAISSSRVVVVLWSKDSVGRDWVKEEAAEGVNKRKLLPVSIDRSEPPFGFRNLHTLCLQGWTGDPAFEEFQTLVNSIRKPAMFSPAVALQAPATLRIRSVSLRSGYLSKFDKFQRLIGRLYFLIFFAVTVAFAISVFSGHLDSKLVSPAILIGWALLLGGIWLGTANYEADYLRPMLGEYLPMSNAKTARAIIPILSLWLLMLLTAIASIRDENWIAVCAASWLLYTSSVTLVFQPYIKRSVAESVREAREHGGLTEECGQAILDYYLSPAFVVVGGGSMILLAAATLAGLVWIFADSNLARDWWRSPHLFIGLEMLYSQGLLTYYRFFKFYPRLDEIISADMKAARQREEY